MIPMKGRNELVIMIPTNISIKSKTTLKQAEAEVVPSSSLVEVEVELDV